MTATYDGNEKRIYIDGALNKTAVVGADKMNWGSSGLKIGLEGAGHYFKGSIDDIRIYNRGLTAAEVTNLYNIEKP